MFHICILEKSKAINSEKCWIEEVLTIISDFQASIGTNTLLAYFEHKVSKEQVFFTLSHPLYIKVLEKKIYLFSEDAEEIPVNHFAEAPIGIKAPKRNEFLGIKDSRNSLISKSNSLENIPNLNNLINYQVLVFNTLKDFEIFSNYMDNMIKEDIVCNLINNIKSIRKRNIELSEEKKWNKKQAEVSKTSLSLIRTEYQRDLKWYKSELQKVIKWYKENHEELPPGFIRLGKGVNALRKKLRINK